jgi:hypothetical protein
MMISVSTVRRHVDAIRAKLGMAVSGSRHQPTDLAVMRRTLQDGKRLPEDLPRSLVARASPRMVRTSMSSPWVSVLGTLAEKSTPIAYTVSVLYSLERLLKMVMNWQRHRVQMQGERLSLRRREIEELLVTHAIAEGLTAGPVAETDAATAATARTTVTTEVIQAATTLGRLIEVETIDPSDPRARG